MAPTTEHPPVWSEARRILVIESRTTTPPPEECVSEVCGICIEPLAIEPNTPINKTTNNTANRPVKLNICGHIWHFGCLATWTETSFFCPMCRTRMFEVKEWIKFYRVSMTPNDRLIRASVYDQWMYATDEAMRNRIVGQFEVIELPDYMVDDVHCDPQRGTGNVFEVLP